MNKYHYILIAWCTLNLFVGLFRSGRMEKDSGIDAVITIIVWGGAIALIYLSSL